MNSDPKIVELDSSSAYLRRRANHLLEADKPLDALDLLRLALEKDPHNADLQLAIAELYLFLGDLLQSLRYLLNLLAEHIETSKVFFLLTHCLIAMGNGDDAHIALREYSKRKDKTVNSEPLMFFVGVCEDDQIRVMFPRREQRAERFLLAGSRLLDLQTLHPAEALLKESVERNHDNAHTHAMLATVYALSGDKGPALREIHAALSAGKCTCQIYCICSEALHALQMDARALALLKRAENEIESDNIHAIHMLADSYGSIGAHKDAYRMALLGLKKLPYDPIFLHLAGVSGKLSGMKDSDVLPYWQTIVRIDPDDPVADYFCKTASDARLDMCDLAYDFELPKCEAADRANKVGQILEEGDEAISKAWLHDPEFRRSINWMALQKQDALARPAVSILLRQENEYSVTLIRYLLLRPETSLSIRQHILATIRQSGRSMDLYIPFHFNHVLYPEAKRRMRTYTVPERKCLKNAIETLKEQKNIDLYTQIVFMWDTYINRRSVEADLICDNPATAAALAYCALQQEGFDPDVDELCRLFVCGKRKLCYYARCLNIAAPVSQKGNTL